VVVHPAGENDDACGGQHDRGVNPRACTERGERRRREEEEREEERLSELGVIERLKEVEVEGDHLGIFEDCSQ